MPTEHHCQFLADYYDRFLARREIRQKNVCNGILPILRRKLVVAKTKFSSSGFFFSLELTRIVTMIKVFRWYSESRLG